jgi:hypothetical protein
MSSKRRRRRLAAAIRVNGNNPQGPVTPAEPKPGPSSAPSSPDRAASSVCLSNENQGEFNLLYDSLVTEHAPATTTERLTVHEMAVNRWRLQRAWLMEAALLDNQMDHMLEKIERDYDSTDEATRTALAFRDLTEKSPSLSVLLRYEARLTRQLDRCLARLASLRATRDKSNLPCEPNPKNEHPDNPIVDAPELPLASSAESEAQPAECEQPRRRELRESNPARSPSSTPRVAEIRESGGRQAPESAPAIAPPLPRAA